MKVHGWARWQTYRRDRASPPWIKVHRRIFSDPCWARLTDAQKGQLVSLWVLAADRDGFLDDDPRVLRRMAGLDELDLDTLTQLGFLEPGGLTPSRRQHDANVTPDRRQRDANLSRQSTEAEAEKISHREERRSTEYLQGDRARAPVPDSDLPPGMAWED